MTDTVDTSKEAVEPVAKDIAGLASREAVTMVQGWEDAFYLYRKTADILRALLAERDQLRREVEEARDNALRIGYLVGFNASGEGWNGEFPYADGKESPEDDEDWVNLREDRLEYIKDRP